MDKLTSLLSILIALSLATERITETIKGLPYVSGWLAMEKSPDSSAEEFRKAFIQLLAIAIGTALTYTVQGQVFPSLGIPSGHLSICLLFGAMASGGSGMWNSALDIVRDVSKQKELLVKGSKSKASSATSTA